MISIFTGIKYRMALFIHLTWCLLFIFSIICFVFAAIFFAASTITSQGCDLVEFIQESPENFDKINYVKNHPWAQVFKVCLYDESANLQDALGITTGFSTVSQLAYAIGNISALLSPDLPDSVSINTIRGLIASQIAGTTYAYTLGTGDSTPAGALKSLNLWSNYYPVSSYQTARGQCQDSQDEWVLNPANCSATPGSISSQAIGPATCFGVSNTDTSSVSTRYGDSIFSNCATQSSPTQTITQIIEAYFGGLKNHLNSVGTQLQTVDTGLQTYLTNYVVPLNNAIDAVLSPIQQLNKTLSTFIDTFTNEQSGVAAGLGCKFIKTDIANIHDNLCYSFLVGAYETAVVMAVVAILCAIGALFAWFFARKIGPIQDNAKVETSGK